MVKEKWPIRLTPIAGVCYGQSLNDRPDLGHALFVLVVVLRPD